jgi:hypothetical protein
LSEHLFVIDNSGLQAHEGGDGDVRDIRVKLLLGILIIVTLAGNADTDAVGNLLDTVGPDSLVQGGVKTDISGTHGLLSKSLDGLDGMGSTLLELSSEKI